MKTLTHYENRLREEVRGVTLLGELPYDEGDLAELRQMLSGMWGASAAEGLRRVAGRYDLALALYLVLEGTYHYDAGDYWRAPDATLRLDGNDHARVGERFRRALSDASLPTFGHLGGHVNVAPILAHVGVPNYCLGDLFDLLERALRRDGASDAATVIAEWGDRDFPPNIDKPVQRFLRFGGAVAEDFVDRCLALMQGDDAPGLPQRVLDGYERWQAQCGPRVRAIGPRLVRPVLRLDPYGEGVFLDLASVHYAAAETPVRLVWRVEAGGRAREEPAVRRRSGDGYDYAPREAINVLTVAPEYAVTLLADDRALRRWALAGPGDPPLLAFDPDTGEAQRGRAEGSEIVIGPGEWWLARPRGWQPAGPTRPLAVLPDQVGEWAGFAFETWRLGPGERLEFVAPDGRRAALRAHRDAAPPRPRLVGPRAAGDGSAAPPLFGAPPAVLWPRHERDEQPAAWRYALEPIGSAAPATTRRGALADLAHRLVASDDGLCLPLDAPELLGPAPFGAFRLALRGPFGRTADFTFTVVPGLRLEDYPRLYLGAADGVPEFTVVCAAGTTVAPAEEASGVAIGAPRPNGAGLTAWPVRADVPFQETHARLAFRGASGATMEADVPLYRLRWGLREPDRPDEFGWKGAPLDLYPDGMANRHSAEIRVDRPYWGEWPPATGWRLIGSGGAPLRELRPTERPGRYVATPLAEWLDAYYEARGPACLQLLLDGGAAEPVAVDVAVLRPSLDLGRVETSWTADDAGDTLTLLWERNVPLRARQLRLWPLERPWVVQPLVLPIQDVADGYYEWRLPTGALTLGEYLAEMVVVNPWGGAVERPEPDAPGVFRLRPTDFDGLLAARLAAFERGEGEVEEAMYLLLAAESLERREAQIALGHALWRRRDQLPLEARQVWANVACSSGDKPAYQLAQMALFTPETLADLAAGRFTPRQMASLASHLPRRLPTEVYVALLPHARKGQRRLCIEELCAKGHHSGFDALLEDVGRYRVLAAEAIDILKRTPEAALDYLLVSRDRNAPTLRKALLARVPYTGLIRVGDDVQTNAGIATVISINDRRSQRLVTACRNGPGPYALKATLSPYMDIDPVSIMIDLEYRTIGFVQPVYKCGAKGGTCDRIFRSEGELSRHYERVHQILPGARERAPVAWLSLEFLHVLPTDRQKK